MMAREESREEGDDGNEGERGRACTFQRDELAGRENLIGYSGGSGTGASP